jgi:phosphoglucomutase
LNKGQKLTDIHFGTSGWRAIISDDFTFTNVRLVSQAIADYIKEQKQKTKKQKNKIIVGYDTRFLSKEFAEEAAAVLASNNINVLLCNRDTPTPVIAYHIINKKCQGGINFTASHNPPHYNGIKFSPSTGGPATPDITKIIEKNIERLQALKKDKKYIPEKKRIKLFNPQPEYLEKIKSLIGIKAIRQAKLKVACDCLYGTSRNYLDYILTECGCKPIVLHNYLNPYFGGKRPEPAPENIKELIAVVCENKLDLGLATDGDADRFGIVDSDGTYITPNEVITLLLYHFISNKKTKKTIAARTVATTHIIDAIARAHGIKILETPVGFKYFVETILSNECIIAGEESGGLSISGHVPEKDGILACLLVAELRAVEKKPLKAILASIYERYGRVYSCRLDIELPERAKRALVKKLSSKNMQFFAGIQIIRRDRKDGHRFFLKDTSWVLFRPSGTEPIIRIYFESNSKSMLGRMKKACKALVS